MSLVALPAELLDAIFAPLPPATLAALARTAAALYPAAAARLYRALAASSFARNLAVVHTLAANPHLAALVREFSLSLDDCDHDHDHAAESDAEGGRVYYQQLQRAVHAMPHLVSLELNVDARASWVLAPPASPSPSLSPAEAPVYARLESFACAFPLDAPTAAFLARTPHLRALQLASSSPSPSPSHSLASSNSSEVAPVTTTATLAPSALPHLTSYTGPAHLLPQLLPARPLAALHLSGDLVPADVGALVSSSSSTSPSASSSSQRSSSPLPRPLAALRTLSALTSAPPAALVAALAAACPAVAHLQILTTCARWEAADVTSALCALPALKTFELSGMHWVLRPRHPSPSSSSTTTTTTSSSSSSSSTSSSFPCPAPNTHTHISGKQDAEWLTPPPTPRAAPLALLEQGPGVGMEDFAEAFMEWAY